MVTNLMSKFRDCKCWKDFFFFHSMLTPWLIQFLFWVGLVLVVMTALSDLFQAEYLQFLKVLLIGPIILRIFCEIFILFFRINDTLSDIKDLSEQNAHHLSRLAKRNRHKKPGGPQQGGAGAARPPESA